MIDKQGKKITLKFVRNLESSIVTDWDRIEHSDKILRLHPDLSVTFILQWSDQISFEMFGWRRNSKGSFIRHSSFQIFRWRSSKGYFIRKSSDDFRFVWKVISDSDEPMNGLTFCEKINKTKRFWNYLDLRNCFFRHGLIQELLFERDVNVCNNKTWLWVELEKWCKKHTVLQFLKCLQRDIKFTDHWEQGSF